ncbi:MAG: hypothetical protein LBC76_04820 [Treponema sp.]|jgi:hypothetical protein|nr:hypothetical protein [Treponema sp.]
MKNILKMSGTQTRWICVIAFVALIEFSMASCSSGGGGGGGQTPSAEPKSITITGIPSAFPDATTKKVGIMVHLISLDNWDNTTGGMDTVAGNSVTIQLWKDDKEYKGTGDFYISIFPLNDEGPFGDFYHTNEKVSIKSANTTIAWSKFVITEW